MNGDETYSNLRINSSPSALEAFWTGISQPDWIGSNGKPEIY
jgi:hypothetical protein